MTRLGLSDLDPFKVTPLPPGYPAKIRTFFSPVDKVHETTLSLIESATTSLHIGMFGFDDDQVADLIMAKLRSPHIAVQLSLDHTQAGGTHERALLAREGFPNTSLAIGNSEHGRIMHMKLIVVDARFRLSGSTNWSDAGERLQDNELTVIDDPVIAQEAIDRLDAIHKHMLAA